MPRDLAMGNLQMYLDSLGSEALPLLVEFMEHHGMTMHARSSAQDNETQTETTQETAEETEDAQEGDLDSEVAPQDNQNQQAIAPAPVPVSVPAPVRGMPPNALPINNRRIQGRSSNLRVVQEQAQSNAFNSFQKAVAKYLKDNKLGKSLSASHIAPIYHKHKAGQISFEQAVQEVLWVKAAEVQLASQTHANTRTGQSLQVQQQSPLVLPQRPLVQPYQFYEWRQFQAEIKRRCNGRGVYSTQASHLYKVHKYNKVPIEDIVAIVMSLRSNN